MATESIFSLRGFAKAAFALLLVCACLCQGAWADTNSTVVATGPISAVATHPATWGQVWQTAISSHGDLVVNDFEKGALYEFPAGGGAMITLAAPGTSGPAGGWGNMGVAIDPWDNLWIGQNWNSDLMRIPYDSVNHTWNLTNPNNNVYTSSSLGANPNWFQAGALAVSSNVTNGTATIVVSAENVPAIYSYSIDSSGNFSNGVVVVSALSGRAKSMAIDTIGNIYFVEDGGTGALRIPAGSTGLANEKALVRVDPNLANPKGVAVDGQGNVYVNDSGTGVYMVPNESGTPNPKDAVLMAALPAFANVDFDPTDGIMYVPTKPGSWGGWTAPSAVVYNDVIAVPLSNVSLGKSATGVQGTVETINIGFAAATTLGSIEIVETGATTDFTVVSGGTCKTNTPYAAGSTCTVQVALDSQAIGDVSSKLELLDASSDVLVSINLSGFGVTPAIATGPVSAVSTHPATWGQVWQTAISSYGDLVVNDFEKGALYEFPAGGGAMITLAAPGTSGPAGGWGNMGVAIDPWNNLWIGQNWNSDLMRIPYDSVNHTWNLTGSNNIIYTSGTLGANPNWFQAGALAVSANMTNGTATMVVSAENVPAIYSYSIDSSGNFSNGAVVVSALSGRAKSLAIDTAGNIYFAEDGGTSALRIAAGSTGLANESALMRVDPNLDNPAGVAVDAVGNVYVGDKNNGVYLVPNEDGTPNPNDAYLLTAIPTYANVDLDAVRGIMYVPTKPGSWGGWNGINDIAAVAMVSVNLGSVAAGTQGTSATVNFGLSAGVTPDKIVVQEAGASTTDFVVASGGSCATGTSYTALSNCSVNVALNPNAAGGVSGKLVLLDAGNNTIAAMNLEGVGIAPAISVTPALESAIGKNLNQPKQVAVDAKGDTFVANSGSGQVLMYPAGSNAATAGVAVGTGLTHPTGIAADGAGDLFIGDSGKIVEVPYAHGGLNTAGQTTLISGLGSNLKLAVDGQGNLYAADSMNGQIVELPDAGGWFGEANNALHYITGFTAPSAVAVDGSNNLYVIDGANLIEVAPNGTQTTLLSTLSGATGLAVDATGAVYISSSGGTVRVPLVSGSLNTGSETAIAASVTNPLSLVLDKAGNVYLTDGTANNLHMVSVSGSVNTGSPAMGSVGTATASVLNIGNAPLSVTGFSSSDAVDFSATGCAGTENSTQSCTVDVTMNPSGPGVQGPISSVITIQSNAANSPVAVDAYGVGAALASSKTAISVASTANVLSVPISVAVTPTNGTVVPTGNVVISLNGVALPAAPLSSGMFSVTLTTGIPAGNYTFTAVYSGDRVYGSSTSSVTATVAKGTVTLILPSPPPYSISTTNDNAVPWEAAYTNTYATNYLVTVTGAASLIPTGTISFMQGSTIQCGQQNNVPPYSFKLGGKDWAGDTSAPGTNVFNPGCLQISQNNNVPNVVTPQLITSIVYNGDANYLPATATTTSAGKPILFEELRNPSVAISPNPGSLSVTGGTGSTTLTVTSLMGLGSVSTNSAYPLAGSGDLLNNYTLPLRFACQGLPAHAACTFSGGNYTDANGVLHTDELSINTDPSVTQTIKVTVTTDVSVGTTTSKNSRPAPFEFASLFGVGLVGLIFGRKSGRKGRALMLICLLLLSGAIVGLTACSTKVLGTSPNLNTPSGTYPVIVTAQQVESVVVQTSSGPVIVYGNQNQMSLPYTLNVTVQ